MFRIELTTRALKFLKKLDKDKRCRIFEKLIILRKNPLPRGVVKLKGERDAYRLRIHDYRILYKILWEDEVILVFKIDHRKRIYKKT